jgi:hypothetical protein
MAVGYATGGRTPCDPRHKSKNASQGRSQSRNLERSCSGARRARGLARAALLYLVRASVIRCKLQPVAANSIASFHKMATRGRGALTVQMPILAGRLAHRSMLSQSLNSNATVHCNTGNAGKRNYRSNKSPQNGCPHTAPTTPPTIAPGGPATISPVPAPKAAPTASARELAGATAISATDAHARSAGLRNSFPTEKRDTPANAGRIFGIDIPLLFFRVWRWAQGWPRTLKAQSHNVANSSSF